MELRSSRKLARPEGLEPQTLDRAKVLAVGADRHEIVLQRSGRDQRVWRGRRIARTYSAGSTSTRSAHMPKEALGRFEARGLEALAREGRLAMVTVSRSLAPVLRRLRSEQFTKLLDRAHALRQGD